MKSLFVTVISLLILTGVYAQKRTLDIGSFSEISFGMAGTIYLTQGNDEKVVVDCDDDLFEEIEFEIRGDRLVIGNRSNWSRQSYRKSDLDIYITTKEIRKLSLSGSGTIVGEDRIKTDDLSLSVSGSGNIDLKTSSNEMDMRISGSGKIFLNGQAERAEISISGSGQLKAKELEVRIFKAKISGSGSCNITALEEITADISGSGSVYYSGDPDRVIGNSSGSGKIRRN